MRVLLSLATTLSLLATASTGSQPEGLRSADWHLPLIGIPVHSPQSPRFHHVTDSQQTRRSVLLTLTESNILAALNPRTGAIGTFVRSTSARADASLAFVVWRQQLPTNQRDVKQLVCDGDSA